MSLRPLRVLAGVALMLGGISAQAEMLPGTVWYSALIKMQEPAPSSAINEYVISSPTLAGCQSQVTYTLNARTSSPYFYTLVSLSGCSFHISGFASAEDHLEPVLFTDFNRHEGVLRERYRIDEYETELSKLYQRLQPAR